MSDLIRVGTRSSRLALAQTEWTVRRLQERNPQLDVEIVRIRTEGDRNQGRNLEGWGTGVFVKDIEFALLDNRIDLAVHSMKDVPPEMLSGLALLAAPSRVDPRDVLVTRDGSEFRGLGVGARVGTSSQRRSAFLRAVRSDVVFVPIRGNVDTRIAKLLEDNAEYDALVLAAAGLDRLQLAAARRQYIDPTDLLPAPGQGALVVQGRSNDPIAMEVAASINDDSAWLSVTAERALVRGLDSGCRLPVGALATVTSNELKIEAAVASPDGGAIIRDSLSGNADLASELGSELAARLRSMGAERLMALSEEKA